ncbi:transposase (fragment) [Hyella patelloides LEGE 07179]|uniref:Transposase n=1 Tax=Hyella patelloides LEGE 07179 TaxID=945734 RepID=A0A563VSY5_9CYAN
MRNPQLALAISNVGWGMLNTMLKYKAEWYGKVYMMIDRFFPSSKIHNSCLYQIGSLPLDVRYWDCPKCGTKHIDRDLNAAKNIRDEALRLLALGRRATACGGTVSLGSRCEKSTTERVPVNQESLTSTK